LIYKDSFSQRLVSPCAQLDSEDLRDEFNNNDVQMSLFQLHLASPSGICISGRETTHTDN
jgi:hypothetical protein